MKMTRLLAISCALGLMMASAAQATIDVTYSDNAVGTLMIGDTFQVDVTLGYDGNPAMLTGAFTSIGWDPAQLQLNSQDFTQPFFIFLGANGGLQKVGDAGSVFPGDAAGTARAIQYGAGAGQSGSAGPDTLLATFTFEVVGAGDGTAEIDVIFNTGDDIFVNLASANPQDLVLTGTSVSVPEPASGVLALSALGAVVWIVRRREGRDA